MTRTSWRRRQVHIIFIEMMKKMLMTTQVDKSLHIKGQMNFMPDWNVVMFLGSPAIANLEQLQVLTNQNLYLILIVICDFFDLHI